MAGTEGTEQKMNKQAFDKAIQELSSGDYLKLLIRGNYGNYVREGHLLKIERGFLFFRRGQAHSYKRIVELKRTEQK